MIKRARDGGFTLIELVVTLAILAILATVSLPFAELTLKRQHERDLRVALMSIRKGLDAYKLAWDQGRITRQIGESGYPKHLADLVNGVKDARDPKGGKIYFMRRIPADPFAPDPDVEPEDTWGQRSYASSAQDPQAGDDVYDVFSKSAEVGLNGIPYNRW